MKKKRLFYLDFIRALATILIVIYHFNITLHSYNITTALPLLEDYSNGSFGQLGVSLFFIISGATLMYTYDKQCSLWTFYKKRVLALFPMFWIMYFLCFVWSDLQTGGLPKGIPGWRIVFSIIGMDGYLSPLIETFYKIGEWFLGCIILLYLIFPLLRYLMKKIPRLLPIIIIVFFVVYVQWYPFDPMIPDRDFLARIPDFLFGMYFVKYIKKVTPQLAFVCLTILCLVLLVPLPINAIFRLSLTGFVSFLLLVYTARWIRIILFRDMFSWISKYSYAVFLVHHVLILQLLTPYKGNTLDAWTTIGVFLLGFILILIGSWLLYQLGEHLTEKKTPFVQ